MREQEEEKMQRAVQEALAVYINNKNDFLIDGKRVDVVMDTATKSKYDKGCGISISTPIDCNDDDEYVWHITATTALYVQCPSGYRTQNVRMDVTCELSWADKIWTAQVLSCIFHNY